jgi:hypothetical protein
MIRRITSRLVWQSLLASVVVLGFALPAAAQGMITGKVIDAKGEPVADAKITIEQTDGVTRKFETKSDKKGEFIQIGLQSASFKVTAVGKDGTATANTRVSQRGPSAVRLVIGGGAGNDPTLAAKTAELRKAFEEGVTLSRASRSTRRSPSTRNARTASTTSASRTRRRRSTTRPRKTTRRRSKPNLITRRHTTASRTSTTRSASSIWRPKRARKLRSSAPPRRARCRAATPTRSITRASFSGTAARLPTRKRNSRRPSRQTRTTPSRTISSGCRS